MALIELAFENYKAFRTPQTLRIRPLTILIGRNSAGKSVIARLPLILGRGSSATSETPLELEFDGLDFGSSFKDLIHNRSPHGAFKIGATTVSQGVMRRFSCKLQHFDEYKLLVVAEFELSDPMGLIRMEWVGTDPLEEARAYKVTNLEGTPDVRFAGLFPISIRPPVGGKGPMATASILERCSTAQGHFASTLGNATYMGPFREIAKRSYRFAAAAPRGVGFSGAKAAEILGHDSLRKQGALVAAVGKWLAEHLGGWTLSVADKGDDFELQLNSPSEPSLRVNLRDVGTGIGQVLALVVQRHVGVTGDGYIEIVEQPELHLHPASHGDLADLYVAATRIPGASFLIETHSENFILRVRRRVAEKLLDPDSVTIFSIDETTPLSPISEIRIDATGEVSSWPQGVFSEDFQEVSSIRQAQAKLPR